MAKGISIHIGIGDTDRAAYNWSAGMQSQGNQDALDMSAIASAAGFRTSMLLGTKATTSAVKREIEQASSELVEDDILLVTYAGHGGFIPEGPQNDPDRDEDDGIDESWLLYDRELIDDELWKLWAQLACGVRVLLISDSCYSGTVDRLPSWNTQSQVMAQDAATSRTRVAVRTPPAAVQRDYVRCNRALLQQIKREAGQIKRDEIGATVLLLAACQDYELAGVGSTNGFFTAALKDVWNGGSFSGDYHSFLDQIVQRVKRWQTPNYKVDGRRNLTFERQRPFTI